MIACHLFTDVFKISPMNVTYVCLGSVKACLASLGLPPLHMNQLQGANRLS